MSYEQSRKKAALPRDVVKWLLSLDLSFYPKNIRRDFSSGYIVAEIFSRYYPQEFPERSYDKGTSLSARQKNWSLIERSLQKQNIPLRKEVIEGTIHCKPGAAELLVQEVYMILTNRRVPEGPELDFTDCGYQQMLPTLARSTASKAIKNNLRTTEIIAKPDISTNQRKAEVILCRHLECRAAERALNPGRFKARPNLCRPAAKNVCSDSSPSSGGTAKSTQRGAAASFKEVKVHQPIR